MRSDRTAFAFGMAALALAALGLWANYGQVDWRIVGLAAPIALVVIGVGMLAMSKDH
ncbi:MAG TPA: hypothetical protein PKD84_02340 [Propionicimonas sp.]|jgi:hypothetical protein|nr:hypothetical protein [Propionicimonas sp.]